MADAGPRWHGRTIARLAACLAVLLGLSAAGGANADAGASHQLVGIVEPVVGVAVGAGGVVSGSSGTVQVTVTRESYGNRTIVTVIPR